VLKITNHGEEIGMIHRTFLCLRFVQVVGFVENAGDCQTEVGTKRVDNYGTTDIRRLLCTAPFTTFLTDQ